MQLSAHSRTRSFCQTGMTSRRYDQMCHGMLLAVKTLLCKTFRRAAGWSWHISWLNSCAGRQMRVKHQDGDLFWYWVLRMLMKHFVAIILSTIAVLLISIRL